jgi:hypothetical protein
MLKAKHKTCLLAALVPLFLGGCLAEQDGSALATEGGGFIFNYRLGEAFAGIVVGPRPLPEFEIGSTVEVSFADPDGGEPIVQTLPVVTHKQLRYTFTTRPLTGIEAGKDYPVVVRLLGPDGNEIEKVETSFRSEVDQSVLPKKPLTIGPGYARNPELRSSEE